MTYDSDEDKCMTDDPNKPDPSDVAKTLEQSNNSANNQAEPSKPTIAGEMPTADHQHAHLKAKQAAATEVDGLMQTPSKLDASEAKPLFNKAASLPAEKQPDTAEPTAQPSVPTPGGMAAPQVSPQLRDQDQEKAQAKEAFKKRMLLQREFKKSARDATDRER